MDKELLDLFERYVHNHSWNGQLPYLRFDVPYRPQSWRVTICRRVEGGYDGDYDLWCAAGRTLPEAVSQMIEWLRAQ